MNRQRNKEVKAMLERVQPMLNKIVQKHFSPADGFTWNELREIAEDAANDAILNFDESRAKWSTHVHYRVTWALLDTLEKDRARSRIPMVKQLKAVCEHARTMAPRGNAQTDPDEVVKVHLQESLDELAGVFGAAVVRSPEEEVASKEVFQDIQTTLDEMPEHYANLIRCRVNQEKTQEETAKLLGVSTAQVCRDEPKALLQFQALLRRRGLARAPEERAPEATFS